MQFQTANPTLTERLTDAIVNGAPLGLTLACLAVGFVVAGAIATIAVRRGW